MDDNEHNSFYYTGRTKEALEKYNTALKLNPSHSVALVNMARQLRTSGKIREAEQAYQRSVGKTGFLHHMIQLSLHKKF